ncbi:MAG: hypothetical protein MUC51_14870 [Anaerolineae bacterium]|nr:hypothetical protein [Anaerolineae bacterium]
MPQDHIRRVVHVTAQGVQRPRIFAREIAQVTAADAAGAHLHQHVILLGEPRAGDIDQFQLPGLS